MSLFVMTSLEGIQIWKSTMRRKHPFLVGKASLAAFCQVEMNRRVMVVRRRFYDVEGNPCSSCHHTHSLVVLSGQTISQEDIANQRTPRAAQIMAPLEKHKSRHHRRAISCAWKNAEANTVPGSSRTSATAVDSSSERPPSLRSTFQ